MIHIGWVLGCYVATCCFLRGVFAWRNFDRMYLDLEEEARRAFPVIDAPPIVVSAIVFYVLVSPLAIPAMLLTVAFGSYNTDEEE